MSIESFDLDFYKYSRLIPVAVSVTVKFRIDRFFPFRVTPTTCDVRHCVWTSVRGLKPLRWNTSEGRNVMFQAPTIKIADEKRAIKFHLYRVSPPDITILIHVAIITRSEEYFE